MTPLVIGMRPLRIGHLLPHAVLNVGRVALGRVVNDARQADHVRTGRRRTSPRHYQCALGGRMEPVGSDCGSSLLVRPGPQEDGRSVRGSLTMNLVSPGLDSTLRSPP
jgi:hypothetical protein